jgi:2-iminobutanoate/2-iminopropanoate deaminase
MGRIPASRGRRLAFPVAVLLQAALWAGCTPSDDELRRAVRRELTSPAMTEELRRVVEQNAATAGRTAISPVNTIGPYSPAVRVGEFLFVSGQIALDPETGEMVRGDIGTETRQVLENVNRVLRAAGYDSSQVVSATVYLTDMKQYAVMNLVYGGYFEEGNFPARVAVEVAALPRGANVEIAVIAHQAHRTP